MFVTTKLGLPLRAALMSAGLAAGLAATPAHAQDHGERMANIYAEHAQQMNDYAYQASIDYANALYDDDHAEDEDTGYYSSHGPPAPLTLEQQYLLEAQRRDRQIINALKADPRFARYIIGGWDHYQSRLPAKPGEYCAATCLNRDGIITLTGSDMKWDGGMLLFVGAKIPRPEAFREVTAPLTQSGDPPAAVRVYNFAGNPAMDGLGALAFAVPSMADALRGMTDDLEFVIQIEGQEVFRMRWKDGLRARDELRKCVRRR